MPSYTPPTPSASVAAPPASSAAPTASASAAISKPIVSSHTPVAAAAAPPPLPGALPPVLPKTPATLAAEYEGMDRQFLQKGLDTAAIAGIRSRFHVGKEVPLPWPMAYEKMRPAYRPKAVRLVVFPLEAGGIMAASRASYVTAAIRRLLPGTFEVFVNPRGMLHVTVHFYSNPRSVRPNPFVLGGDTVAGLADEAQLPPAPETCERENATVDAAMKKVGPPTLELERVTFASSGVLLLLWTDPSGKTDQLRQELRDRAPGSSAIQPSIIHTSLLRVLTPEQLSEDTKATIHAACAQFTQQLRGMRWTPGRAWLVHETLFSCIEGPRTAFSF